jgi:hypothetical protein
LFIVTAVNISNITIEIEAEAETLRINSAKQGSN